MTSPTSTDESFTTQTPTVEYYFDNIEDPTKATVKSLVQKNLSTKLDLFLKHIYENHPDANVMIRVSISKDSNASFGGSFSLDYPASTGQKKLTYERNSFNDLLDLINHAFQHFKLGLSQESKQQSEHHAKRPKEISSTYGKDSF